MSFQQVPRNREWTCKFSPIVLHKTTTTCVKVTGFLKNKILWILWSCNKEYTILRTISKVSHRTSSNNSNRVSTTAFSISLLIRTILSEVMHLHSWASSWGITLVVESRNCAQFNRFVIYSDNVVKVYELCMLVSSSNGWTRNTYQIRINHTINNKGEQRDWYRNGEDYWNWENSSCTQSKKNIYKVLLNTTKLISQPRRKTSKWSQNWQQPNCIG